MGPHVGVGAGDKELAEWKLILIFGKITNRTGLDWTGLTARVVVGLGLAVVVVRFEEPLGS